MTIFPEEIDFLSLFESEPILFDTTTKDLPFYYNKAMYQFSNEEDEDFSVTLSPSVGEVEIQVVQRSTNRLLSFLNLKRVEKFEITADKKLIASVLLTIQNEDSEQIIEIDFKPNFKLILKEYFTR